MFKSVNWDKEYNIPTVGVRTLENIVGNLVIALVLPIIAFGFCLLLTLIY